MKKKDKTKAKIERLEIRRELKASDIPKNAQEAKGQFAQTGMLVVRDMVLGGFIGGMVGSGLGRFSLIGGVAATGLSYYFGMPGLAGFGIGMAAAGLNQKDQAPTVAGTDKEEEGASVRFAQAQERMKNFAEGFKRKLWLDKISKKKEQEEKETKEQVTEDTTTSPEGTVGMPDSADPLAEIEQQLVAEAINFQRENGVKTAADFAGFEDDDEQEQDDDYEDGFDEQDGFEDEDDYEDQAPRKSIFSNGTPPSRNLAKADEPNNIFSQDPEYEIDFATI